MLRHLKLFFQKFEIQKLHTHDNKRCKTFVSESCVFSEKLIGNVWETQGKIFAKPTIANWGQQART